MSSVKKTLEKLKAVERFATYAYSVDLFRMPPWTGIDKEEALSQLSDLLDAIRPEEEAEQKSKRMQIAEILIGLYISYILHINLLW